MPEKQDIPDWLKNWPEARAEEDSRNQAEWAANTAAPFGSSAAEMRRAQAERDAKHWESVLHSLAEGAGGVLVLPAAENALTHPSECYAELGNFDLAAKCAPHINAVIEYQALHDAVMRDDGENCACPDRELHGDVVIDNLHVSQRVFSRTHGKEMDVVRCGKCGFMNVKPLPDFLHQARASRRAAVALVQGREMSDHAQLLQAAGLDAVGIHGK